MYRISAPAGLSISGKSSQIRPNQIFGWIFVFGEFPHYLQLQLIKPVLACYHLSDLKVCGQLTRLTYDIRRLQSVHCQLILSCQFIRKLMLCYLTQTAENQS